MDYEQRLIACGYGREDAARLARFVADRDAAATPAAPGFPALTGDTVTEAHVQTCRERGHATHTVNGADTGVCPRCGEVTTDLAYCGSHPTADHGECPSSVECAHAYPAYVAATTRHTAPTATPAAPIRTSYGRLILANVAALVVAASALVALAAPVATAATTAQPYGGCDEAWMAPQSAGADWCRAHGWTVRARIVVGPRGWVRYSALPSCHVEDASSGPVPCSWNLRTTDGNGRGLAYWVTRNDRTRYVWPPAVSPVAGAWDWAPRAAPGGRRCVIRVGPTSVVKCPDGRRFTS